ncbi:Lon-like protease helical domain-containing protein, partial [Shewanella sp. 0m-11]
MPIKPLSSTKLYRVSALNKLSSDCKSTKHLEPLDQIVGQARAQQAVEFALSMKEKGYNIYALGRNGLGKRTMVLRHLNRQAPNSNGRTLYDWCYVVNFDDTRSPKVLKLPAGMGLCFKKDIEKLMSKLLKALPLAFDNEMYYSRADKLKNQLAAKQEEALLLLTEEAKSHSVGLSISPQGNYELVALNGDEPHTEESYLALSAKEQDVMQDAISALEAQLRGIVRQITIWEEEYSEKQQKHDEQVAEEVLTHSLTALKEQYKDQANVKA